MSVLSPVTETLRGLKAFLRGWQWLRAHPKYMGLLFIPMGIGLVFLFGGLSMFVSYDQTVIGWILPARPEAWYWLALYWIGYVLLYLAVVVLALLSSMLMVNAC